jgi:wobble nucleotide-excising tRNase
MSAQPERISLDDLTSDQLDALYDDLDRYEEVQGEMNERAVDLVRRVAGLEQQVEEQIAAKVSVAGQWGNALADKAAAEKRVAELEAEAVEHLAAHEQETANTAAEIDRARAAEAVVARVRALVAGPCPSRPKPFELTGERAFGYVQAMDEIAQLLDERPSTV